MSEIPDVAGGQVITAAHINTIAGRTVQRYVNSAARDAALPAPVNGDLAFLIDPGVVTYYSGTVWGEVVATRSDQTFIVRLTVEASADTYAYLAAENLPSTTDTPNLVYDPVSGRIRYNASP